MIHSIAGLNEEQVRTVVISLCYTNNEDLAKLYLSVLSFIDKLLLQTLHEMHSTTSEIAYWEHLAGSSPWDVLLYRVNSKVFRFLFSTWKHENQDIFLSNVDEFLLHIQFLRYSFNNLAVVLAKISDAAAAMKSIFLFIRDSGIVGHRCGLSVFAFEKDTTSTGRHVLNSVREVVLQKIGACIVGVCECLSGHIDKFKSIKNCSLLSTKGPYPSHTEYSVLESLLNDLHKIIDDRSCDKDYPLSMAELRARKPSNFERFWFRRLLTVIVGVYSARVLAIMISDGSLRKLLESTYELIVNKIQDKIVEPLQELFQELFDTISRREAIVSRADLESSRRALQRMLDDFSTSQQGSDLILLDKFKKLPDELKNSYENFRNSNSSSIAIDSVEVKVPQPPAVVEGGGAVGVHNTPEEAYEALMNEYEKELQTPIRGIIWGSLMTAVLIQMQKLKVHTEGAMLTMDQILASNELTIAATAALPAFTLFGVGLFYLHRALQPKASLSISSSSSFKSHLADVERSLEELLQLQTHHHLLNSNLHSSITSGGSGGNTHAAGGAPAPMQYSSSGVFDYLEGDIPLTRSNSMPAPPRRQTSFSIQPPSPPAAAAATGPLSGRRPRQSSGAFFPMSPGGRTHVKNIALIDKPLLLSRGLLYYHVYRLRNELHHFYGIGEEAEDEGALGAFMKGNRKSFLTDVQKCIHAGGDHAVEFSVRSAQQLLVALFKVIFGSSELSRPLTQFDSLNKDLLLLEAPDFEVNLTRKLAVTSRMRLTSQQRANRPIN